MVFPRDGSRCDRCRQPIPPPVRTCTFRAETPSGRILCYDCAGGREQACVNGNWRTKWVAFIRPEFLVSYTGARLLKIVEAKNSVKRVDGKATQAVHVWAVDGHGRKWYGSAMGDKCYVGGAIVMRRTTRQDAYGRPEDFGDPQTDCGKGL